MKNVSIICICILLVLICLMNYTSRKRRNSVSRNINSEDCADTDSNVCCGKHAVCEKQRLADAMTRQAIYFEDEDLDRFAGRASGSYSDDEIEEFRYVMDTMRPEEIREWAESLQVRSVELPDQLKDEVCMMLEE